MFAQTPIALTIAGSDSGGGAGIQADLKAMSANGAFAASVVTVITAQNTTAVTAVHEIPTDIVAAQIDAVLSDLAVGAIKLGMLFSVPIIEAVAKELADFDGPIVVDPVMIAKSGDALLQNDAVEAMIEHILPLGTLVTPNLPEAARLLSTSEATTHEQVVEQGQTLAAMTSKAVLMKGGHGTGGTCTDVLIDGASVLSTLSAPRIDTQNTHGTGCTYSASIAANLAKGQDLKTSVENAHDYLKQAIGAADTLTIGNGHGPVHHFHGHRL